MVANILQHILHPLRHCSPCLSDGPEYRRACSCFVPVRMIPHPILYDNLQKKLRRLPAHRTVLCYHGKCFLVE